MKYEILNGQVKGKVVVHCHYNTGNVREHVSPNMEKAREYAEKRFPFYTETENEIFAYED